MARKIIGWLLIAAGLAIVSSPLLEKLAYDRQQGQLLAAFDQLGEMEDADFSEPDDAAISPVPGEKKKQDPLKGGRGILSIEKIDLEMMIFEGVSENELGKGAGMIEPKKDFTSNNIGLAGHRAVMEGKQFNRLGELEKGDEIQVNTKKELLNYRITDTFVVHKSDVSVLEDQDTPQLTLVTCTPLGSWRPPDRLIVQAELIDASPR